MKRLMILPVNLSMIKAMGNISVVARDMASAGPSMKAQALGDLVVKCHKLPGMLKQLSLVFMYQVLEVCVSKTIF